MDKSKKGQDRNTQEELDKMSDELKLSGWLATPTVIWHVPNKNECVIGTAGAWRQLKGMSLAEFDRKFGGQ